MAEEALFQAQHSAKVSRFLSLNYVKGEYANPVEEILMEAHGASMMGQ